MRGGRNGLRGRGTLRLDRSGLLHRSAVTEQPGSQEKGGENKCDNDAERKVVKFWEQRRPLQMRGRTVVARFRGASYGDGLGLRRRLRGSGGWFERGRAPRCSGRH